MAPKADITGQTFGMLKAIRPLRESEKGHGIIWLFECECGKGIKEITVAGVRRRVKLGITPSCGCRRRGDRKQRRKGIVAHALYDIWRQMRKRCENPAEKRYCDYGGRGIKVCERWQTYKNFYADILPIYYKGGSMDRIDNEGDYEPGNVRYTGAATQNRNRRDNNVIDTPRGPMVVTDAAKEFGISEKTLRTRVNKGWSQDRLFSPPQYCGKRSISNRQKD